MVRVNGPSVQRLPRSPEFPVTTMNNELNDITEEKNEMMLKYSSETGSNLNVAIDLVLSATAIDPSVRLNFCDEWNLPTGFVFFGVIPNEYEAVGLCHWP